MIDTKTEQRIIFKRAEGKGIDKIMKELSLKSYNPIKRVIKKYPKQIADKSRELRNKQDTLNRDILFYAKNKLLALLKSQKHQSGNELANIAKALDTIQRLDDNKPTSISNKRNYTQMTDKELMNEARSIVKQVRSNTQRDRETQV